MESNLAFMAFTVACFLLLLHYSFSQTTPLESCEALEGTTICDPDAPTDDWLSQVMADAPIIDSDDNGVVSDFSITWIQDPQIPQEVLGYIVVVREVGLNTTTAVLTRRLPFSAQYFLRNLLDEVAIEVMVCNASITVASLPAIDEFSAACGYCRTCFNGIRFSGPGPPRISLTDSTVEIYPTGSNSRFLYKCEAFGNPTPQITWNATSFDNPQVFLPINNGIRGISISNIVSLEPNEVESILLILADSLYQFPICIATNSFGSVTLNASDFVNIPAELTPPVINGSISTVEESTEGFTYTCVATGIPAPDICWAAFDESTELNETFDSTNSPDGITITTTLGTDMAESTLVITQASVYSMPTCVATNPNGTDSLSRYIEIVTSRGSSLPDWAIVVVFFILFLILSMTVIGIIIMIYCVYKRRKILRYLEQLKAREAAHLEHNAIVTAAESSLNTHTDKNELSLLDKLPQHLIVSSSKLQVSTIIGQGEFGVVYKGYLKSDMMDTVAVKTLKGIFTTANDIENVTAEIMKMHQFDHPNVMQLIGVCLAPSDQGNGPCIVMPFMAKGSLLDHLRKEADNLFVESEEDFRFADVRKSLIQMCLQIAKGMEYLAKKKFVHRDLAARNCLMDAQGIIKVSDFGLAEDIYSQNYFRQVQGGVKLPLKWMALESIKLGVFTEKTDVWSYGITCWEIYNGGAIPYPGVHPHSMLNFLEEGRRLSRPKNAGCCEQMYECMCSFWDHKADQRPTFSTVVTKFSSYLATSSDYLDLSDLPKDDSKAVVPTTNNITDGDPEHSITRIPSSPNDYFVAGEV